MISGNPGIFEECFWRGVNDVNAINFGAWEVLVSQLILFCIFQTMRCQSSG